MPRHQEPEFVTVWRKGPPHCCHTCDFYGDDGVCLKFKSEPPEDFASTPDACASWLFAVPF